ncbi:MAG TPA: PEP/pyruvate-binding domain-containing protein [Candidatus Acidoferrales bacterium]|nr:PEP/pyruvate-binding domain-containing protein [Candidatus Acidoferrales bacterium]
MANDLLRNFTEIGIADRPSVGGKGASLGEMSGAGLPVPHGCVVTTAAFERFLRTVDPAGSIRRGVAELLPSNLEKVAEISTAVRARIESSPLPLDLAESIRRHYFQLAPFPGGANSSDHVVAIRSSATSEDTAETSFAGLQDTYLWVRGAEQVLEHVRKCWASLYSVESIVYRRRLALPEDGLAIAVVIQRMIDSRCSGVMFTRSPTTGDRSVVVLEASWGLGSAVVSGEVTPDKYVIGKITGEILSRTISAKTRRHRPNPLGGIRTEEVPLDEQGIPCLTDGEIHALLDLARRVERHYGCPQDIEWAIAHGLPDGENVFLLQSRPETVWAGKERTPVAGPRSKAFDHVFSLLSGGMLRK